IEEAINFSVLSADGKTVHQQQLHGNVNGLQLPKGLYFAVFKTTNQVMVKKIVMQ
ncbi:MAG: T9SS type A sorting domain-containing protein, partial [Bacteroidales bacterium]|nr:T9SS type A sorting domain-containing protein [Bacteroidales bacterium]